MESIKDRLSQIMRSKNLTASQFADIMGIQPSNVSHLLNGRNKPSLDFLVKLKDVFPEYSFDWIILGKKPMTQVENYVVNDKKEKNIDKIENVGGVLEFPVDDNEVHSKTDIVKNENSSIASDPIIKESSVDKIIVVYDDKTFEILKSK